MLQAGAQTCSRKPATIARLLFVLLMAATAATTAATRTPAASHPISAWEQNNQELSVQLQPCVAQSCPRRQLLDSGISGWFKDVLKFVGIGDSGSDSKPASTTTPSDSAATPGSAGSASDTAGTSSTSTTSTESVTSSTGGATTSSSKDSDENESSKNSSKGKDKKGVNSDDLSKSSDDSDSTQDAAEKLRDAATSSSADPTVPATPLMPQPGEELPVGLKQVRHAVAAAE